jgi:tRNA-Thr(GGU) m(6)t(6)A37 methyltransferase TsaA
MDEWKMRPIGYIRSSYTDTKQVPKGLGTKHTLEGTLEVLPEFEDGLLDIEGYSHLFILWVFHRGEGYRLIGRPPTDNRLHGVFSTRSPRRPNAIGLTVVELLKRKGPTLHLRGIDMLDGTPVLDIKPYTSSIPMDKLRRGWLEEAEKRESAGR